MSSRAWSKPTAMTDGRKRRALLAATVLAALLGGCGSDDDDDTDRPASKPAATSASATARLTGEYVRTMTEADLDRTEPTRRAGHQDEGPGQERPKPDRLLLELRDGTLTVRPSGDPAGLTISQDFSATVDGAFRIGAYQHPERGSFCGPEVPQTATYTWKRSGSALTLEARNDMCADRDSVLSGAWKPRSNDGSADQDQ